MNKSAYGGLGAIAVCFSMALFQAGPASAQAMSPAPMMAVDCSKAGDMMMQSNKMDSPAMTGDVDKDYMAMAMAHQKSMMMLMHVEMSCGKNEALKKEAAKSMREADERLEMFRNQSQS